MLCFACLFCVFSIPKSTKNPATAKNQQFFLKVFILFFFLFFSFFFSRFLFVRHTLVFLQKNPSSHIDHSYIHTIPHPPSTLVAHCCCCLRLWQCNLALLCCDTAVAVAAALRQRAPGLFWFGLGCVCVVFLLCFPPFFCCCDQHLLIGTVVLTSYVCVGGRKLIINRSSN